MTLERHFGTPGCTGRRSEPEAVNDNAPDKKPRDRRAVLRGFARNVYVFSWVADWIYWASDGAWHHIIFGWLPALLWPIHLAGALLTWALGP